MTDDQEYATRSVSVAGTTTSMNIQRLPASNENGLLTVDVVVPVYNKMRVVRRAIDSALQQRNVNVNVIVVDDGSTDALHNELRSYADDPRVRVLAQPNAGPGAARNAGARVGQSDYLAFLDADDEWGSNFLSNAARVLHSDATLAVAAAGWVRDGERSLWTSTRPIDEAEIERWVLDLEAPVESIKARIDSLHTSACVVRRDVFERFGGFFEHRCTYGEDAFLWARILVSGLKVATLPVPLLVFHTDASALSLGRVGPYPPPPLLTRWRDVVNAGESRATKRAIAAYLAHYARFVFGRARKQRSLGTQTQSLMAWVGVTAYRAGATK